MNRLDLLLAAYSHYDTIYTGLILFSVWAAATGHLVDWLTVGRWRAIIPIYWTLLVTVYVAGIVLAGLS